MLNYKTLGVAERLALILRDRGLYAEAESGSLLETLVDASRPQLALQFYATPVATESPAAVGTEAGRVLTHTSMERDPNGEFRHGRTLEECLQVVTNSIRADHDFARNGVNPVIRRIVEAVEAAEAGRSGEGDMRPNVAPYFYADLWDNSTWMAMVDRFADQPVTKAYVARPIELAPDTDLMELLLTGSDGLDTDVKALIDNRGEEYVHQVYRAVFCNDLSMAAQLELRGNASDDGWFFSNSRIAIDSVVVAHLLARSLHKRGPVEGEDKAQFDASVSSVIGASGQRLHRSVVQRQNDRKGRQLVIAYGYYMGDNDGGVFANGNRFVSARTGHIVVNGDLYNEYLEAGGSPEALMGAAYGNQPNVLEEIVQRNEEFLKAYQRHEATLSEQLKSARYSRVLEMVRVEVYRYLNTLPAEELTRSREEYVMAIREELSLFRDKDLDALWYFVRRTVCRVFFPHTNALRCLTKIDDVASRMPNADVQIASFHATIEILVDWLFETISIRKG